MSKQLAIVVSEFNASITEKLLEGAYACLIEANIPQENIYVVKVPGAIEIPLIAKLLAKKKAYNAIICLGAVIRGETDHYDYVCEQVSQGCQKVMLDFDLPVLFGILTTNTIEQAADRVGGKGGHKGRDVSEAALAMIKIIDTL